MPFRSPGTDLGFESPATIAHKEHDVIPVDLGIDRYLGRAGPLGRVHRCLPGRIEQGSEPVGEWAITDHHDLDGDAVIGFDLMLDQVESPR